MKSAEIQHPSFTADRVSLDMRAPADLRLVVRAADLVNTQVSALLRLEVVWRHRSFVVDVPLAVTFDKNGKPDTRAGEARAFPLSAADDEDVVTVRRAWPALKPQQQELLFRLVDWERSGEDEFYAAEPMSGGAELIGHQGVPVVMADIWCTPSSRQLWAEFLLGS